MTPISKFLQSYLQARKRRKRLWEFSEDDLKNQVENYHQLKITQSYRGISVVIMAGLLSLTFLLTFFDIFNISMEDFLYTLFIYVPILVFVYRGHRWAIITLMIIWTIEKGYSLIVLKSISAIPWWVFVMSFFHKAS